MLVGHILDHVLDHMIIGLVTTALQLNIFKFFFGNNDQIS